MKYRDLVIQYVLIILFGAIIFYLINIEFKVAHNKLLVIAFALVKSIHFVYTGIRKIIVLSRINVSYGNFLAFIAMSIALIVISFAVDYLCLYQIDPSSFSGIEFGLTWYEKFFNFYFFSVLVFSNVGVVTVAPNTIASEFIMMIEAILSFVTIILVLSDFVSLKESIQNHHSKKRQVEQKAG